VSSIGARALALVDFYSGAVSLIAVSLTVLGGVLATDRMLLRPRHRVRVQRLHRAAGIVSVGFLVVHVTLQVVEGHVRPLDVAVPFLADGHTVFVGLGTVAAELMILLAATGVARGRFAYGARPALWRAIHATAYLCWPIALVHGLRAGREPALWVTLSYGACVAAVVLGLLVRAIASWRRRARKKSGRVPTGPVKKATRVNETIIAPAWESLAPRGAGDQPVAPRPRAPIGLPDDRPVITSDEEFWDFLRSPEPDGQARRR
jgi:DMSO/TMAO reductase YedYZ heme-binding membrane subunit